MDETRKRIIIQEINSWKESRMIPEQYCNYLLALYCQGELPPAYSNKTGTDKKDILSGLIMGAFFVFIVFLNYFTEIPIRMQIAVTTISIIIFGFLVSRCIIKKFVFQLTLIEMALLMLLHTVKLIELVAPGRESILYTSLFIHCGLWILIGKKLKLLYFSISGCLGVIITLYFLLI
ncbi:hypothetical protein [Peribacillus sp. NPDC096540]|uniref:hypothetical protein n=1 Tax=Peribacillus sp. NPDC096540 TaxID=3390612 RepID=UPI003D0118E9